MKYRKIATETIDTTVYSLFFFNFGEKWAKFQLKGRKAQYIQYYLGDLVTGTVDQEVNTVSGRVGTLCICLGEVGGGRLAFFCYGR